MSLWDSLQSNTTPTTGSNLWDNLTAGPSTPANRFNVTPGPSTSASLKPSIVSNIESNAKDVTSSIWSDFGKLKSFIGDSPLQLAKDTIVGIPQTTINVVRNLPGAAQTVIYSALPGVKSVVDSISKKNIQPLSNFITQKANNTFPNNNIVYGYTSSDGKPHYTLNREEANKIGNLVLGLTGGDIGEADIQKYLENSPSIREAQLSASDHPFAPRELPGDVINPQSLSVEPISNTQAVINSQVPIKVPVSLKQGTNQLPVFKGFNDISTNILNQLEGKDTVSKQFISDLTNSGELKQQERDVIRSVLEQYPDGSKVPVQEFADKVHEELLPLKANNSDSYKPTGTSYNDPNAMIEEGNFTPKYENVALPEELRGNVANYKENIYESPIATSAGDTHFEYNTKNYFGHTRVEDMGDGNTRRVIEVQSDLYQKGNLEKEGLSPLRGKPSDYLTPEETKRYENYMDIGKRNLPKKEVEDFTALDKKISEAKKIESQARDAELSKLQQYNNPTAHFRMVREEIKKAAQDEKSVLQFPTGDTAMYIEGLAGRGNSDFLHYENSTPLKSSDIQVGQKFHDNRVRNGPSNFIIVESTGKDTFKAVPLVGNAPEILQNSNWGEFSKEYKSALSKYIKENKNLIEEFSIAEKVDTNNPIYKFYEKELGKYLKNKYKAQRITDKQGVSWWEVNVDKSEANKPVTAFKKGKGELDITPKEAESIVRKYFTKDELSLFFRSQKDLNGAIGMFELNHFKSRITLLDKGGKSSTHTAYHEIFHAVFNMRFTEAEREIAINKVLKNPITRAIAETKYFHYENPTARAEEFLADDYARYIFDQEGYKGVFRQLWNTLLGYVRKLIRKITQVRDMYEEVAIRKGDISNERPITRFEKSSENISQRDANKATSETPEGMNNKVVNESEQLKNHLQKGELAGTKRANQSVSRVESKAVPSSQLITKDDLAQKKLEIEFKEEALQSHLASKLGQYVDRNGEFQGSLPEVTGTGNSRFGRRGDSIIAEHGFDDVEEARAAYEDYKKQKQKLLNLKREYQAMRVEYVAQHKALPKMSKGEFDRKTANAYINKRLGERGIISNSKDVATLPVPQEIQKTQLPKSKELGAIDRGEQTRHIPNLQDNRTKLSVKPTLRTSEIDELSHDQAFFRNDQKTLSNSSRLQGEGNLRSLEEIARQQARVLEDRGFQDVEPLNKMVIDRKLDVKTKVGIHDFLRTPSKVLEKIGMGREAKLLRGAYDAYLKELPKNIDKITKWSKEVPKESNKRIFKYLDGEAIDLRPDEKKVALEIKDWLKLWASRLRLQHDNRIGDYITHIFEKEKGGEFDPEIAKLIDDKIAKSVYDPFLLKRTGAKGYKQDTWAALDAYVKRGTRKVHMDPILEEVESKAQTLDLDSFKYVQAYVNAINMRPGAVENWIDNSLKQIPLIGYKLGQRPTLYITSKLRKAVYRASLGLNFSSALKNLTQGVNTFTELGSKYTTIGYIKLATLGTKELNDNGVIGNDLIADRNLSSTHKFWEKTDKVLYAMFEADETINRGAAYYGAKSKAIAEGKTEEQAIIYAKDIVRKTQFSFDNIDTPVALSNPIIKTLGQFQTFTLKQAEFLGEKFGFKKGAKDAYALFRYIASSFAIFGLLNIAMGKKPKDAFLPQNIYQNAVPSLRFGWPPPALKGAVDIYNATVGTKDKYGNTPDTKSRELTGIGGAAAYIPASVQAKKTIQGISQVKQGASKSPSGAIKYGIPQTTSNYIRAGLFGPNNLPQAQNYFNKTSNVSPKVQSVYGQAQKLKAAGKIDQAQALVDSLSDKEYKDYKKLKANDARRTTVSGESKMINIVKQVQILKNSGRLDEAQTIVDGLSDQDYKSYKAAKKKLGID